IYLLDLKNDEHWNPVEDECCLCGIEAVPGVVRDVPRLRDEVNQRNAHLAFELIESSHENGSFHYITTDDQIIETFDSVDVSVTSLLFEPRATALFVGFSFGQFHIFSLQDLSLIFSSDTQRYSSAVVRFAFQEPENDPRNFCYLWVVKESTTDDSDENSVTATMHQLMYQHNKIFHKADSIISLYSNLECCSPRYELTLDATLGLNPIPTKSQILQCSTIEHYSPVNEAFTDEEKEEHSTPYISLLILGWESFSTGDKSRNVQLVVFDLNR
uniref:ELYS beta-propeller domain-containing protein n=1 Tax=Ciona savignyi TaxID=51511 RepID=H2ZMT5_CIOSA